MHGSKSFHYELSQDRAVVVQTNGSGRHWVTITKTKDGLNANEFKDFHGIDPWFNGTKPPNPNEGSGLGSKNSEKSGVIPLVNGVLDLQNKPQDFIFRNNGEINKVGYCMFTFNFD